MYLNEQLQLPKDESEGFLEMKYYGVSRNGKIAYTENLEDLNYVAKSLGLNPAEDPRVIHQPDESLSVDLTLILGKDFSSIKSIQAYMDK